MSASIDQYLALFLGSEKNRRRRTAMAALATVMMVCCVLAMHLLAAGGELDARVIHWWSLFALGGLVVAMILIRTGVSERMDDPSMTMFQMQWALTWNAVAYVISGPIRALALPVLVIILMFGIFGRDRRQTLFLMAYAMSIYTLAVLSAASLESPRPTFAVVAAHLAIVLLSLLAGTLMCLQVQSIRAHLRRQKRDLELALVKIRDMAMRDELTGLFNRRQMIELMGLELKRSQRLGHPLVLAQLDIDHFKSVNDQHGHATGDRALKEFGKLVSSKLRSGDVLARWGGEEFVLLLSDTSIADAAELLERLRSTIDRTVFPLGSGNGKITVSIGWTAHRRGESLDATLARADQALYRAKHQGRNQVVLAQIPRDTGTSGRTNSGSSHEDAPPVRTAKPCAG